jgi:HEAT repeat protein
MALVQSLESFGIDVWLDKNKIKPGQLWEDAIKEAISSGDYFIACFSDNYNSRIKSYMNEELILAIDELRQRPSDRSWFIPVRLTECDIPNRRIGAGQTLRSIQWVDVYNDWNAGIQRILSVISPGLEIVYESIQKLSSNSARDRIAACDRLASIGNYAKKSIPMLLFLLKDENETVRRASVGALRSIEVIDEDVVIGLMHLIKYNKSSYDTSSARRALLSFGEPVIECLLSISEKDSSLIRIISGVLGGIKDINAARAYLDLIKHKNSYIRSGCTAGLGSIFGFNRLLKEEDKILPVKIRTSKYPELLDELRVVQALIGLLYDNSKNVRFSAVCSLKRLGGSAVEAIPYLIDKLDDSDPRVRSTAAEALPRIARISRDLIHKLITLLSDHDISVVSAAAYALGSMNGDAAIAIPDILEHKDNIYDRYLFRVLGEIGDKRAVPVILDALGNNSRSTRSLAALELGNFPDANEEVIPKLVKLLNDDEDDYVRIRAAVSLGQLGYEPVIELLIDNLEHMYFDMRNMAALGIAKIGIRAEKAFPAIINAIKIGGVMNIPNAVLALESIATTEAITAANEYKKRMWTSEYDMYDMYDLMS